MVVMTKLNRWIIVALVGWLMMVAADISSAGLIRVEYLTRSEVNSLFGGTGVTIAATGQFRAGGSSSPEIRVQNGEMNLALPYDQGNLTWDIGGGDNLLSAGFGGSRGGFFGLEATGSGGTNDSAYSLPTIWYNQVLVDISSPISFIDIFGDVNGRSFSLATDPDGIDPDLAYDAALFTFDNAEGTTPVWEMSANMSMTTPFLGLADDDFQANVIAIQNFQVVPEPAPLTPVSATQYMSTRTEANALFSSNGVTVIATGQFRAGGSSSPEIRVQNGEMNLALPYDQGNLTWDIKGGDNLLSAGFGTPELAGAFQLEATGSSNTTDSAYSLPTMWFNQVLVDIDSPISFIDIFGDVNGQSFSLATDPDGIDPDLAYDAILFTFDNTEGTTPVWEMSANMSMTTPFPGLINDDFQANVYLIQNLDAVSDPSSFSIQVLAAAHGVSSVTNVVVPAGGGTNITHMADTYYYVDYSVHVFGNQITTNTYGVGSNVVVETISNVQTNGTITTTFDPYVTTVEQLPHWWLAQYYDHTNDFDSLEGTDTDLDGFDVLAEYISGTIPTNSQSVFAFHSISGHIMQVQSVPGRDYTLWRSSSLLAPEWSAVTSRPGTNAILDLSDPAAPDSSATYQLTVELIP